LPWPPDRFIYIPLYKNRKNMRLRVHPYDLRYRHTFAISREVRTVQRTLIVELHDGDVSGFGEATANAYYNTTIEGMIGHLENLRHKIETFDLKEPGAFWEAMKDDFAGLPFPLAALDEAAHDLYARRQGKPLHQLWGLQAQALPLCNYTIGIAPPEEMLAKMKAMPWPVYKIKLGTDHDLEIIKMLRKHTDALFRVDANCAWTAGQTIAIAPELKKLGVEFIEQPLPAEDTEGMKAVFRHCALPVIADESCRAEADVAHCAGLFHGINIKLMKCGGITPALRMISKARSLGLKVMVGCMTESSVGIAAIGQLLPMLDYVDMDGAMLITNDPATGVCIDYGQVHLPGTPGTGARLKSQDKVEIAS